MKSGFVLLGFVCLFVFAFIFDSLEKPFISKYVGFRIEHLRVLDFTVFVLGRV